MAWTATDGPQEAWITSLARTSPQHFRAASPGPGEATWFPQPGAQCPPESGSQPIALPVAQVCRGTRRSRVPLTDVGWLSTLRLSLFCGCFGSIFVYLASLINYRSKQLASVPCVFLGLDLSQTSRHRGTVVQMPP